MNKTHMFLFAAFFFLPRPQKGSQGSCGPLGRQTQDARIPGNSVEKRIRFFFKISSHACLCLSPQRGPTHPGAGLPFPFMTCQNGVGRQVPISTTMVLKMAKTKSGEIEILSFGTEGVNFPARLLEQRE